MDDDATKLLTFAEVRERTTLSRMSIKRLLASGKLAAPIQISPGRLVWRSADIGAYIASCSAGTPAAPQGEG